MGWRWFKRRRLPGGLHANLSSRGAGWSWGLPGLRVGVSPYGRKWVSVGIPGTGLRYFRYLSDSKLRPTVPEDGTEDESDEIGFKSNSKVEETPGIKSWRELK
jgi:hypothetical protein